MFVPGAAVAPALFCRRMRAPRVQEIRPRPAARDEVMAALAVYGLRRRRVLQRGGHRRVCRHACSRRAVVVAFRGTEQDPKDLATDARFVKVAWPAGAGSHGGFATAIDMWRPRSPRGCRRIPDPRCSPVTAWAARLRRLAASRATPARLVTFGCPRVGDAAFVATLAHTAVERYVDCCDVVCRVPPAAFGFVHPVAPTYIDADGIVHTDLATMDVSGRSPARAGRVPARARPPAS